MRGVVQRVTTASVSVDGRVVGAIQSGLVVLIGVANGDGQTDIDYVVSKIRGLRVFEDEQGRMNRSVVEAGGSVLAISQFTLAGDVRRGLRPAFDDAAPAEVARPVYESVLESLRKTGLTVEAGVF